MVEKMDQQSSRWFDSVWRGWEATMRGACRPHDTYPETVRPHLMTLEEFIGDVRVA